MVSDSFENALLNAVRGAEWFVYGISVYENYHELNYCHTVSRQNKIPPEL